MIEDTNQDIWTDPGDSPLASYEVDYIGLIDSESDQVWQEVEDILKDYPINHREASTRIKNAVEKIKATSNQKEMGSYLAEMLRRIIESRDPRVEAVVIGWEAGLQMIRDISITDWAKACGLSKQALDKRLHEEQDRSRTGRAAGQKRASSKLTYKQIAKKRSNKPCSLKKW